MYPHIHKCGHKIVYLDNFTVNTTKKFAHAPTVCTRLFSPPPQEPGNEASASEAKVTKKKALKFVVQHGVTRRRAR